jgi:hypothetical protein
VLVADIDWLSGGVSEILDYDAAAFGVGPRVHPDSPVHRHGSVTIFISHFTGVFTHLDPQLREFTLKLVEHALLIVVSALLHLGAHFAWFTARAAG